MFIFYDTETTGLSADFDQILQIALVFTDENLNILASKKMECRRSPWVIPSPGALLITGFTPDDLKTAKLSHHDMMKEIVTWTHHQHWPVIFAGYNTVGFDESILARNLEQTLQDPALTMAGNGFNKNSNGRFDVFLAVKAALAYMPGLLKLDAVNDFGSISLSLSSVAEQNGVVLSSEDAHDAMNDIRATLGVARVIRKAAPDLWTQMVKLSTIQGVNDFISTHEMFTHTIVAQGKPYAIAATEVAEGVLFDLSKDPSQVMKMTAEELASVLGQKKSYPFRKIEKAEQPILMPIDQSDAVLPAGFDDNIALARAKLLKSDKDFLSRLAEAQAILAAQESYIKREPEQYPMKPLDPAVQAKLDEWKREFLTAPNWEEATRCVDRFYKHMGPEDGGKLELRRFVNFAGRTVFEHAPQYLSAEQRLRMSQYIARRVLSTDPNAPWTTIAKARTELEKIERERSAGVARWKHVQDKDIRSLKLYYTMLEKEYSPFLAAANDNPLAPPQQQAPKDNKFKP